MRCSLRPLAALGIALVATTLVAACAETPAAEAPPQPPAGEPPPMLLGGPKGTSDVDREMLAIGKAEEQIDRLLPSPTKAARARPGTDDKKKDEEPKAPVSLAGDACATACQALASMVSSAEHLCKLAGEGDGRCEDARGRVRGASARVRSACPTCAAFGSSGK